MSYASKQAEVLDMEAVAKAGLMRLLPQPYRQQLVKRQQGDDHHQQPLPQEPQQQQQQQR